MRTQTEADRRFLELVQASLQASAKEAERLAQFTGTALVRIESSEPTIPEELVPFLSSLGRSWHDVAGNNVSRTEK